VGGGGKTDVSSLFRLTVATVSHHPQGIPRLPRPIGDGLLYHALNRGNHRDAVFFAGRTI
jgi:hypothetical protein